MEYDLGYIYVYKIDWLGIDDHKKVDLGRGGKHGTTNRA